MMILPDWHLVIITGGQITYLLQTILDKKDLQVEEVVSQHHLKSGLSNAKEIILDVTAKDSRGTLYDIEIQEYKDPNLEFRARFYSSMLDTRCLLKGQKFKEMKKSYSIFICEEDFYGEGEPIYYVDRDIHPIERPFNDGNHILIVNGQYKGNDSIGDLIHDLHCKEPNEIKSKELKELSIYYKEKAGNKKMCELVEQYVKEHSEILAKKLAQDMAQNMAQDMAQGMAQDMAQNMAQDMAQNMAQDMAQGIVKEEIEKSRIKLLNNKVKSLSKKLNVSITQSMQLLDIDNEDQVKILAIM